MAAPDDNQAPQAGSLDSRQKVLIELALIVFGFSALPLFQGLLNQAQAQAPAPADPGTPAALLGQAWNLALMLWFACSSPSGWRLPGEIWRLDRGVLTRLPLVAAVLLATGALLASFLPKPGASAMPFAPTADPLALSGILLSLVLAVGFEELLYRVYLLERLTRLGASPLAAIGIAVCLFALGHQYQGLTGLAMALILGTLLSLAWMRWRSFWLNSLAHLLYNLFVLFAAFYF